MAYRTVTPDPYNKIALLEIEATISAYNPHQTGLILTEMNTTTKILLGERVGKTLPLCDGMKYLNEIYGKYNNDGTIKINK